MSLYEITQSDRINKNVNLYVNSINTAEGASSIIHTSELILTSNAGITSSLGVNIGIQPYSGQNLNLTCDSGNINITTASPGNVNIQGTLVNIDSPVVLQNSYTTISTTSQLSGYSTGTFELTFSGNCITASSAQTIKYTRIGNIVILQFPDLIFIKNNGAASQIVSSAIPTDLRPTIIGSGSYYMQLTSLQDQPLTDICFAVVEYDNAGIIRLSKNDNFSTFSQAVAPNNVQISACALTYLI